MEEERNQQKRPKEAFKFEALPLELKHEVLKKLKTKYLEEVCANVSQSWEGMVGDILEQRKINAGKIVPEFFRKEMIMRTRVENPIDNPLEMLKFYEGMRLSSIFGATGVLVNEDVLGTRTGLLNKIWNRRSCDCQDYSDCLMGRVHILSAFNLLILNSDSDHGAIRFYHLSDIELLETEHEMGSIVSYTSPRVDSWIGNNYTVNSGISVFRDLIALEKAAKTILLLKVASVDHLLKKVVVERVRLVHLPLWTTSLCLFEDKLVVLYSTGHVGMWDKTADELFISESKCDLGGVDPRLMHRNKLFRVGNLALVRAGSTPRRWYVVNPNDRTLAIRQIDVKYLIDSGLLPTDFKYRTNNVYQIDIWYNCLVLHWRGEFIYLKKKYFVTLLIFKRIQRYPTVEDFFDAEKFRNDFLVEKSENDKFITVNSNMWTTFSSPFIPSCLKEWRPEAPEDQPGPVADLIAAQVTWNRASDNPQSKLRALRVRLANLPFNQG